jgi:2-methylcitrate dehydratase PrpD
LPTTECARPISALPSYELSLLDWIACSYAGRNEPATAAARAGGDSVAAAGVAGHVLDFDDTYLPGIAHLSAPVAPVACVLGAEVGADATAIVRAYAEGVEAMGAVAAASHPALYNAGWHPTSVCGVIGSAAAASILLNLTARRRRNAIGMALLRAGGLLAAFGSHGKSLQVGMAASTGVWAARAAAAGGSASPRIWAAFERAYGATWSEPDERRAVDQNWIKAYPCCLQTHSAIEAADEARRDRVDAGSATVLVHPVSRQAAPYDEVATGLEAKFSIPYLIAYTLLHGPPNVASFDSVDGASRDMAARVAVVTDPSLVESEAIFTDGLDRSIRVEAARGSPQRPMNADQLAAKVRGLAGDALDGFFDAAEPGKVYMELMQLRQSAEVIY